jgi:hypothetical protein
MKSHFRSPFGAETSLSSGSHDLPTCALLSAHKNEGPYLLDFVAHHLAINFTRIFIVTNPSDDGTTELAQALAFAGFIEHVCTETPKGRKPQHHAYSVARQVFDLDLFDWLLILDADEFLNIHVADGTVNNFLAGIDESVDIVSINTACFGNFPHSAWTPLLSSRSFRYRLASGNWRNAVAKSIFRKGLEYGKLKPHGPDEFQNSGLLGIALHGGLKIQWVRSDDRTFYSRLRRPGAFAGIHGVAQINHYLIRTWDEFQIRTARGRGAVPVGLPDLRHTRAYFDEFSVANVLDETIERYSSSMEEVRQRLLRVEEVRLCHEETLRRFGGKMRFFPDSGGGSSLE